MLRALPARHDSHVSTLGPGVLVVAVLLTVSASAMAQPVDDQVPIPGVTTTLRVEGAVDQVDGPAQTAIVKTADGVRHLFHLGRHSVVHRQHSAEDAFGDLQTGSRVLVHYVEQRDRKIALEIDQIGDFGLTLIEGTVQQIDRRGKRLTIQLADDSVKTLRLTDRAARDAGMNVRRSERVIVYYADDDRGESVAHYFKQAK